MIFRFLFIIGLQSDKLMGHSEEEVVGALVEEKQEGDTNQNLPLNCKEEGGKGMKVEKVDTMANNNLQQLPLDCLLDNKQIEANNKEKEANKKEIKANNREKESNNQEKEANNKEIESNNNQVMPLNCLEEVGCNLDTISALCLDSSNK